MSAGADGAIQGEVALDRAGAALELARIRFDVEAVRADFPGLHQEIHGQPLAYLDSAASAQKPRAVINALTQIYLRDYSNVHRGVHALSQRATDAYEAGRRRVARFLGAEEREVVFVRGVTEAINLVAWSFARPRLNAGDRIVLSAMEHHANIVPWQQVCQMTGAELSVVPIDDRGVLDLAAYDRLLAEGGERVKMVAMIHVSNALGTINPAAEIVRRAKAHNPDLPVLFDGAQAAPHHPIDVKALGCDFYAISGHKVFGPTGIGALYGRFAHLDAMPPWQGGGDMIRHVSFEQTTYAEPPQRFEAGTPHIAGVVGLAAALDYLERIDHEAAITYEQALLAYAAARLDELAPHVRPIGVAPDKASVLAFVIEGVHPHDIGTVLDQAGIAIRAGHHCAQPLMDRFGLPATARASFAFYNTRAEVDRLIDAIGQTIELFGPREG